MNQKLDQLFIKDLLVRGIIGALPEERIAPQNILLDVTLWVDTSQPARTDDVADTVNYAAVGNAYTAYFEAHQPQLVEYIADDLLRIGFATDARIQAIELQITKPSPSGLRFAGSVGIRVHRTRDEFVPARPHA